MTKCCYSYNSMCSCTLGCMPVCWTLFHSHERLVGLCLQLVFRSTCRALTRACPNTGTPCFRTFGPGTRTWPVFAQGGGVLQRDAVRAQQNRKPRWSLVLTPPPPTHILHPGSLQGWRTCLRLRGWAYGRQHVRAARGRMRAGDAGNRTPRDNPTSEDEQEAFLRPREETVETDKIWAQEVQYPWEKFYVPP